ncbi:phosphate ABC transporter substrate-binding protein PstS [Ornithinicoccus halotolerans]|uniref:phosphate ABC transporter substrate-binding protein PstS n=1 Tax=Ornithinicoccus halotolerans TaxID=1748220 RepID=UPI001E4B864C|nr:phosphate ABC transporter substrate-binding protein PstS [Ornithinicoccus halotolerans]
MLPARPLRAAVTTALAGLALVACGDDNPTARLQPGDVGAPASGGGDLTGTLTGSGSSAQESAQTAWIAGYQGRQPGVTVHYDSIGSGGGRENIIAGATDFAGSDAYLDQQERQEVRDSCGPKGAMNLPVYISPIAVPYNLPGVESLQLTPDVLAGIFNREISRWDDPAIAEDNPDEQLPDLPITAVNRSDESGTTENFLEYLTAAAPHAWPHEPGAAWPVEGGEAAAQTTGVIEVVSSTPGAIGYADASAIGTLQTAAIGVGEEFVTYSPEAAARVVDASEPVDTGVKGDLALDLARDTTESGAYPIVLVSYLIVCHHYEKPQTATLVQDYVGYIASEEGQATAAEAAGSAPISDRLRQRVLNSLELVTGGR